MLDNAERHAGSLVDAVAARYVSVLNDLLDVASAQLEVFETMLRDAGYPPTELFETRPSDAVLLATWRPVAITAVRAVLDEVAESDRTHWSSEAELLSATIENLDRTLFLDYTGVLNADVERVLAEAIGAMFETWRSGRGLVDRYADRSIRLEMKDGSLVKHPAVPMFLLVASDTGLSVVPLARINVEILSNGELSDVRLLDEGGAILWIAGVVPGSQVVLNEGALALNPTHFEAAATLSATVYRIGDLYERDLL
jgi:hypothetical protein